MAKNIIAFDVLRELWTFSGTVLYKMLHSPGLLYNVLDLLLGNRCLLPKFAISLSENRKKVGDIAVRQLENEVRCQ